MASIRKNAEAQQVPNDGCAELTDSSARWARSVPCRLTTLAISSQGRLNPLSRPYIFNIGRLTSISCEILNHTRCADQVFETRRRICPACKTRVQNRKKSALKRFAHDTRGKRTIFVLHAEKFVKFSSLTICQGIRPVKTLCLAINVT